MIRESPGPATPNFWRRAAIRRLTAAAVRGQWVAESPVRVHHYRERHLGRARVTGRASAHGTADRLESAAASPSGIVAWYAQGFADRLGDRLLLFDNTGAQPLELLRIAQRLTGDPTFEPALRERVEELKPFRHPAFARVRGVSVLAEPTPQLALVSEHIPGERLSQILRAARAAGIRPDPGTALWLVRQLMPAVSALHEMGAEIAHGTLSPDRIVVTPTGDLVVTEYVFAHAIETLGAEPTDLWKDLGVAVRPGAGLIDQGGDIEQVALLALAVLLGRPLAPDEYPRRVGTLLEEACDPLRWSLVPPLRQWLDRALRIRAPFSTAREALETLDRLLPRVSGMWASRLLPQNLPAAAVLDPVSAGSRPMLPDRPWVPPPASAIAAAPSEAIAAPEPEATVSRGAVLERAAASLATSWEVAGAAGASLAQEVAHDVAAGTDRSAVAWAPRGIFAADTDAAALSDAADPAASGASAAERETIRRLWLLCGGLAAIAILEALCLLAILVLKG